MVTPFKIDIEQSVIDDLKKRIANTRWTYEIDNDNWKYGTNKSYLQELSNYWQNTFDWQKQESFLNSFRHFKSRVDGVGIHFIHEKGEGKNAIPLLLTHGWPDSFIRFLRIIPLLTKEDENGISFDVVVPSIPGHGFSDIPMEPGMNVKKVAKLLTHLMTEELGYERFVAHGGDLGTGITEQIALYHSGSLLGIHMTDIPYHHILSMPPEKMNKEEKKYFDAINKWQMMNGAYNMIQGTRPQSLAYGLDDSPVGLAAWIVEKFYTWSDCDGNIENCFTKDELLTNVTIYWVTQTINSSFRHYVEAVNDLVQEMYNPLKKINPLDRTGDQTDVPTAIAESKIDLLPPKDFANKYFNIQQWTKLPKGGHFAAMEQPELIAEDIRKFVNNVLFQHSDYTAVTGNL